jgi:hypothetical protein
MRDTAPMIPSGKKIANEVTTHNRVRHIPQAGDDEDPRKEQVPLPAHRQPSRSRHGRPGGKGSRRMIGISEDAGRLERTAQDGRDAFDVPGRGSHRPNGCQGFISIGSVAPVQRRMGIEDLQAAHDEDHERNGVDPMCQPNGNRVPVRPPAYFADNRFVYVSRFHSAWRRVRIKSYYG